MNDTDILYSILWESKVNFYKEKLKGYKITKIKPFNNFLQFNIMFDTLAIKNDIWPTNLGYLMVLVKSIDLKTNEVDYNILWLSDDRLKKIKTLFKQKWFVKRLKLDTESKSKYYFNPNILYYWKGVNIELINKFN